MDFLLYLNTFDFFILLIFFSSLLIGISRGLYIEIISNAIWISAILIAWFFRYYPMEIFDNFTNDKEIKSIFSFVSIFIVLLIIFRITGKAIMKGMNSMQKGLLDRIFGGLFIVIIGFISFKHIIMALSAPFMGPISKIIEDDFNGVVSQNSTSTSKGLLLRGIRISLRNLLREFKISEFPSRM